MPRRSFRKKTVMSRGFALFKKYKMKNSVQLRKKGADRMMKMKSMTLKVKTRVNLMSLRKSHRVMENEERGLRKNRLV